MKVSTVFTIGHSTRSLDEFIGLLKSNGVTRIVDIRTVPRSRHNPQFNTEILPGSLEEASLAYQHCPGLGGLRRQLPDSPNRGWRNASFRGFADYMQTRDFKLNLDALVELAKKENISLMCAEAVPWRCHRSLIADALMVHGIYVAHIISKAAPRLHTLTAWAVVDGDRIYYPSPEPVAKRLV